MTNETDSAKPQSGIEELIAALKRAISNDEPNEEELLEVGESLYFFVKEALS